MAKQSRYDVVIVGASIAGSAAAILFGRNGARVALIERDPDPAAYKRLCTHFIQSSATPTIERLGLTEALEKAGAVRNEIEIYTRWGWIVPPKEHAKARPSYGYSIRRSTLDPILRKTASQTAGVEYMSGASAARLLKENERIAGVALRRSGDIEEEVAATLVVGADGRQSKIAELAGLQAKETPNGRLGYLAHYRNLPLSSGTRSQMWFLEPNVAYAFPNDDGVTVLAAMPAKSNRDEWKADPEAALKRIFSQLPAAPDLGGAQRVSPFMGVLEYPNLQRQLFKPGLALIGDAALSIDPLWGVGCGWAFQSAEWLAKAVGASWSNPKELDRGLASYAKQFNRELAGHRFLINDFSSGRPFNLLERLMFSAAARDPACADHVAAFGARCIGAMQFLSPFAMARAAWVNLRFSLGARPPARTQTA